MMQREKLINLRSFKKIIDEFGEKNYEKLNRNEQKRYLQLHKIIYLLKIIMRVKLGAFRTFRLH